MSKKLTSGWLCRDFKRVEGNILFFPHPKPKLDNDGFFWLSEIDRNYIRDWTLKQWQAQYTLKPPAYGKKFEVEIEL
ncbi:MAG TPA: hypothetical protein ENI23_06260 [bacterium]|nr:hypothetical protein [bacterium]